LGDIFGSIQTIGRLSWKALGGTIRRLGVVGLLFVAPVAALGEPTARLIHFTTDGTQEGAPLLPGFDLHSVWSGLGQTDDGTVYIAVSNHNEVSGNVAIFALDPGADQMRVLGDLKSVSLAAGNWDEGESQYKVHTFLQQAADGLIYFATMPSSSPEKDRGAHIYSLNPQTDEIRDVSAVAGFSVTRRGDVASGSGVVVQQLGIKGMGLHPDFPDVLYLMTYGNGALLRYDLRTGLFQVVGHSARVSYVFHVDAEGDVYYLGGAPGEEQGFLRYNAQTGETTTLVSGIAEDEEVGMIVPTANPDVILVLLAKSKEVFPVHTVNERRLRGGTSCGRNWWRLFNMAVSPDGKDVFFVSNNNDRSAIWRAPVGGGSCVEVLDVDGLLGSRNLAFGGQNIWVGDSFYTPVWTHEGSRDVAILEVTVK